MISRIKTFNEIQKLIFQSYKTALHLAVQNNNIQIIKLLLKMKDIDINIEDSLEEKPIDYARNKKVEELLYKNGH